MEPFKQARTHALGKTIAIFVTMLMVVNLTPVLAQTGPVSVTVHDFSNGLSTASVQLDAGRPNASAGVFLYKNTQINTASVMLESNGLTMSKNFDLNNIDDFNRINAGGVGTEAKDGTVHMIEKTNILALMTAPDFMGGESNGVVADFGVHLVSGLGVWEQQSFALGPGYTADERGAGFSSGSGIDYNTGDGALRIQYYYKPQTWNATGSLPSVRAGSAYATDPSTNGLYIFGGWTGTGLLNDTYELGLANNTWFKVCNPCNRWNNTQPVPMVSLGNASMIYNPALSNPEIVGGDTGMMNVQTMTYSLKYMYGTHMWLPGTDLNQKRTYQSEVYDGADHLAIVFGGMDNSHTPTNSIFTKGNSSIWNDISSGVANLPPVRYGHSAVWDPVGKKMYIFGGMTGGGTFYNDLWVYDSTQSRFDRLAQGGPTPTPPPARAFQSAMWDPSDNAMIIYGGRNNSTVMNDIWAYWPANDTWQQITNSVQDYSGRWGAASGWNPSAGSGTVWGGMVNKTGGLGSQDLLKINGQFRDKGQMVSSVVDAGATANWNTVFINATGVFGNHPVGDLTFEMRTGPSHNPDDGSWTNWMAPNINLTFDPSKVLPNQFMQYRLTLSSYTHHLTPVVYNVTFTYDISATSGYLTTHEYDLRQTPLSFSSLDPTVIDVPYFTTTSISIDYRDDPTEPWSTDRFVDNASLSKLPTGRYIRFNISMTSTMAGMSPYLETLTLSYVTVPTAGYFQLKFPADGNMIVWIDSKWNSTDSRPGMGQGSISVLVNDNNNYIPLTNGQKTQFRMDKPFQPLSLILNINFTTDGHSDPRLMDLHLMVVSMAFPSEVSLDIGNDGSAEFNWPGVHYAGQNDAIPNLQQALQTYLQSNAAKPDGTGHVLIPLALISKTPGIIAMKGLIITGTIANIPPNIVSKPPINATVGLDYKYLVNVDNKQIKDLNFTVVNGPNGMIFSGNTLLWSPDFSVGLSADVKIGVSDGIDTTYQNWTIRVDISGTNHPPEFKGWPPNYQGPTGTVPMRVGDSFNYHIDVVDQDVADVIVLTMERGPPTMTLKGEYLKWTPGNGDAGNFTVILRASDGKGSAYQTFRIIVGANSAPTIDKTIPKLQTKVGSPIKYQVVASDHDKDPLTYNLTGAPSWLAIDPSGMISGKPGSKDAGTYTFKVVVSDGHLNTTADVIVAVSKPTTIGGMARDDFTALLIILLLVCIVVIVVAFVIVRSRKKKAKAAKLEAELAATRPAPPVSHMPVQQAPQTVQTQAGARYPEPIDQPLASAPAAVEAPLPQPTVPMAQPVTEEKPVIEEIYLIYNDGRLIAHQSSKGDMGMDEHVLSGMLKAIQDFVKDSFQKEGALGGLDYGDSRIMLESGNCATFAIVLKGKETKALREETRRALEKIEGLYSGVIECWDGDTAHFGDVKKYFGPIFALGKTQEEQAEAGEVKVLSSLEFYQGYVRLKAAVKNTYPYMVYEVTLKILYDKKALQLTYIEPEYEREGSEVVIGNIPPNEKKTVAFYLDPLICMESSIDATALFKNYKGELKTVLMKRRPVDIVCPIFYTEQNVNVAMLKRLITELKYKDSKIYTIPKSMLPSQAMDLAKAVISARDVKFVREFTEDKPFMAEAWFYGKTKHTLEDLVIRATMREENGLLEIYVCSNNLATLPGLLADLGHGIKKRYMELKKTKDGLTQVTDVKVKDELEKSRMLIDKYVSTEAEAHSDENEL